MTVGNDDHDLQTNRRCVVMIQMYDDDVTATENTVVKDDAKKISWNE